jgi:hypothetical protein
MTRRTRCASRTDSAPSNRHVVAEIHQAARDLQCREHGGASEGEFRARGGVGCDDVHTLNVSDPRARASAPAQIVAALYARLRPIDAGALAPNRDGVKLDEMDKLIAEDYRLGDLWEMRRMFIDFRAAKQTDNWQWRYYYATLWETLYGENAP